MTVAKLAASLLLLATLSNGQQYSLVKDYSGQNFFSGFTFNESAIDFNNFGNVHFLSQANAMSSQLAFVDANNHIILKVDNTTNGAGDPTFGRNSIYLLSNDKYKIGSLMIFDANHIPYGCSVWPGFFTQGVEWPAQGEIDIIENVNQATANQYALHVGFNPCNQPQGVNQTGKTTSNGLNCTVEPLLKVNTAGCVVLESQQNSFGQGFAQNGGGVYAMLWDTDGIRLWFFPRPSIPGDISATGNSPNPAGWGTPSAFYPADGCNPTSAFGDQIITFYIDICGAFAGADAVFQQTCASAAPNCSALVPDPANYNNAFWDINYLRVFSNNPSNASTSTNGSSVTGSGNTGGSNGTGANNNPPSSAQALVTILPTALAGFVLALGLAAVALV